jgi:hypothetical protein
MSDNIQRLSAWSSFLEEKREEISKKMTEIKGQNQWSL